MKKFWPIPVLLLVLYVVLHKLEGAFCPMVIVYVLKGQFSAALFINPSVYLWIAFLLYIIVVRYILGKPLKRVTLLITVMVAVMVIRFGYGMYMYYPARPPFSYTGGNVMENIIPGYMHLVRDFKIGGY